MMSYDVCWEDEDSNRRVQFSIGYEIENSEVKIANVTPTAVSFLCSESNEVTRTIGVHTVKGKEMLAGQFASSGRLESTVNQIAEESGLLIPA